jgi:pSer/pThr/pTyr-binding forkhead associated (FHA) protein/6-phosphogluconolactonase (cycloisomerase 2 family)
MADSNSSSRGATSPSLHVLAGPAAGRRLDLDGGLEIGREAPHPGRLGDDPELSRRHARITCAASGEFLIEDLGSTNGTRVNGLRVEGVATIRPGDRIELGDTTLELLGEGGDPSSPAGDAPVDRSARTTAIPLMGGSAETIAMPLMNGPGDAGSERAAAPPREPASRPREPAGPPPGPPTFPDRSAPPPSGGGRLRMWAIVLGLLAVAAAAAIAIVLATRGNERSRGSATRQATPVAAPFDGTAYIETNSPDPDSNAILALRYRAGSLVPLRIASYPTGGSGSHDLADAGVLDADQQVIVNARHTLLFAINQSSDTVAVFHIATDGSLQPVKGSPFPSGGKAPGSLGISGDILVVANKAHDGVRDLRKVAPNYTTFRIRDDGSLEHTGTTITEPARSSPTQVFVAPGGRLVFTTEESGVLRAFRLGSDGSLTEAPNSPAEIPTVAFPHHHRTSPVWPAGLSANPRTRGVLYTGLPNLRSIATYTYAPNGALSFASHERDPAAVLPCWSVVSRDGRRLYFANAGSDNVTVWDVGSDPQHPRVMQTVKLPGGGNPWNLQLTPDGKFLFVITPRQVAFIPKGAGQLIHVLAVGPSGKLAELDSSPVTLPVALNTNPLGLVLVPRRS